MIQDTVVSELAPTPDPVTIVRRLQELRLEVEYRTAELRKLEGTLLDAALAAFFRKVPEADVVAWDQYTPYEGDPDSRIFSVNRRTVKVNGIPEEMWLENHPDQEAPPTYYDDLRAVLDLFYDGELKILFGDHKTVTATSDGSVVAVNHMWHE